MRRFTYDELMKVESITSAVSSLALSFGEGGSEKIMSRPFGVALLFAGIDKKGPRYDKKRKNFASGDFLWNLAVRGLRKFSIHSKTEHVSILSDKNRFKKAFYPHAPVAQKIADQRWLIANSAKKSFLLQNDVIKGWLVWINIVFCLFNLIRSNKL